MGKRGPKPVDIGTLNFWEFEWYKALHVLRDGVGLPGTRALSAPPLHISPAELRAWLRRLKDMTDEEFLRINNLACEQISGDKQGKGGPPDEMSLWWARTERQQEINELETYLNPRKIPEEAERREIWKGLWRARTPSSLKKVCEQWANLRDVRGQGLTVFTQHVLANTREFLRMKRDRRFPKSDSPVFDESRLEFIARGMAGILANVSPMTAIEKLRNMSHGPGGPLWRGVRLPDDSFAKGTEACQCWHCELDRSRPAYKISAESWWNGMALFMRLAGAETKLKVKEIGQ